MRGWIITTGLPSHMVPRARRRQDSLFGLRLSSPFPFSLSVAYNVLLQLGLNKYPSVALLKGRQLWPDLPLSFACVSGQPWPLLCLVSVFVCVPSSCSPARLPSLSSRYCLLAAVVITTHAHRPTSLLHVTSLRDIARVYSNLRTFELMRGCHDCITFWLPQ